jgi:hypothetical protein
MLASRLREPTDRESLAGTGVPAEDDEVRRVAHELLGATHGFMFVALDENNIGVWCSDELVAAARNSSPALWRAFGQAQAEIAGGSHDQGIADRGLSHELAVPKRRGLAGAVQGMISAFRERTDRHPVLRRRLQNALT